VPRDGAADASGLLTTTMQLSQVLGVAGFGTVFLSVAESHDFTRAISTTGGWLAVTAGVGLVASIGLSRTVLRARQPFAAAAA
jgi:hypothetical protein